MSVQLTYLGHSGFLIHSGATAIALDPFLTGNPVARHKAADVKVQYIGVTHGHSDHLGDTLAIARGNRATVYAAWEICNFLQEQGYERCEPGNPGGQIATPFGFIAFTQAFHSSSYEGRYMGLPCGLIVHVDGKTIYHCGDTGIFGDMRLLGEIYQPDVALIPIGDRFTMGPGLATRAAEMIGAKVAVPIHYNTWPPIAVDSARFAPEGVEVKRLKPGEVMRVE